MHQPCSFLRLLHPQYSIDGLVSCVRTYALLSIVNTALYLPIVFKKAHSTGKTTWHWIISITHLLHFDNLATLRIGMWTRSLFFASKSLFKRALDQYIHIKKAYEKDSLSDSLNECYFALLESWNIWWVSDWEEAKGGVRRPLWIVNFLSLPFPRLLILRNLRNQTKPKHHHEQHYVHGYATHYYRLHTYVQLIIPLHHQERLIASSSSL